MKNQRIRFALALLGIFALTACTNTIEGVKKDTTDISDWAHNKPSKFGDAIGSAPTGYGEKPQTEASGESYSGTEVSQPASNRAPYVDDQGEVWHHISNYNAGQPSLPSEGFSPGASAAPPPSVVKYSPSVDVYPVNKDMTPYADVGDGSGPTPSGEMIKQVFFPYGSAAIGSVDRQELREMAQSLNGSEYRLDVVGHASKRVDHVRDPARRELINFKMAQKRANAVVTVLRKSGVSPEWVVASSAGDNQPNLHRNGKSQEAADRRAEIFLNN